MDTLRTPISFMAHKSLQLDTLLYSPFVNCPHYSLPQTYPSRYSPEDNCKLFTSTQTTHNSIPASTDDSILDALDNNDSLFSDTVPAPESFFLNRILSITPIILKMDTNLPTTTIAPKPCVSVCTEPKVVSILPKCEPTQLTLSPQTTVSTISTISDYLGDDRALLIILLYSYRQEDLNGTTLLSKLVTSPLFTRINSRFYFSDNHAWTTTSLDKVCPKRPCGCLPKLN